MPQQDIHPVLQILLWFESPLWSTAKGNDSQDLLSARINGENIK